MRQQVHCVQRQARAGGIRSCLLVALLCTACTVSGGTPTATPTAAPTATRAAQPTAIPTAVPGTATTPAAATVPGTTAASSASVPSVAGPLSEGVHVTGADAWQEAGFTGKGVKIGIIDGGFVNYARVLGNAKVTAKSFRADELIEDPVATSETIHGTACAEIVHEMAPDAELYLATIDTEGSFLSAIQWLTDTIHTPIITTSLGFYGDYPADGSNALAQAVDKAKAVGVFFVKSAGNFADKHYGAVFQDADGDGFHDFPGAKTKNGMTVRLTGAPIEIFLNWDDWVRPHVNYDLYLYNSAGQEMARSDIDQAKGRRPVEHIQGTLPAGTYTVKIKKLNARDPDLPMNLLVRGGQPELTTPGGSLTVPGDARGAITVAAIDVRTDVVEPFSSHGPTLDGREKPDIGAPDHVMSRAYASVGATSFFGTSAAAPHVGGAAALYKQANPDATPDAILAFLTQRSGIPQGTQRGQNVTGSGRLNLGPAPGKAAVPALGTAPAATAPVATAPATVTPRPGPLLTDDFSSPRSGLPAQGYVGNAYRVAVDASTLNAYTYSNATPAGDLIYEVQARKTSGADDAMTGLVVRRTDARNAIYFVIANDGVFNVESKVSGNTRSLVGGWQPSAAIVPGGVNTLRVSTMRSALIFSGSSTYVFSVNGQEVARVTVADTTDRGSFGFLAGGGQKAGAEITFTRFTVIVP